MSGFVIALAVHPVQLSLALVNDEGQIRDQNSFTGTDFSSYYPLISRWVQEHQIQSVGIALDKETSYLDQLTENIQKDFPHIACKSGRYAPAIAKALQKWNPESLDDHSILVYLGDDIHFSQIIEGAIYHGHHGLTGNLGKTLVEDTDILQPLENHQYNGQFLSKRGIRAYIWKEMSSKPQAYAHALSSYDLNHLLAPEQNHKEQAKSIVKSYAYDLGVKISDLIAISSPRKIYLSGPVAGLGSLLAEEVKSSIEKNVFTIFRNKIKVEILFEEKEALELKAAAAEGLS